MSADPMEGWSGFDQQALLAHLRDVGQYELEGFIGGRAGAMGSFAEWLAGWKERRDAAARCPNDTDGDGNCGRYACPVCAKPDLPCNHATQQEATVDVHPLVQCEGGPVTSFSVDVRIQCVCGEPFVFIDLPFGLSPREPRVSFDGQELRLPVRPADAPDGWGESGPAWFAP